jgi:hypothetical protein
MTFVILFYATVTHIERILLYRFVLISYSMTLVYEDTVGSRAILILLLFESLFLMLFLHLIHHSGTEMTSIFVTSVFTTDDFIKSFVILLFLLM